MADSSNEVDGHGEGVPVEVRELSLTAGSRTLLARATARFEAGQITLIVGPSGAGKSLLLRVLAGLVPAGPGEVRVTGQVVLGGKKDDPSRERSEPVGVVFQSFALFDELSPLDNVRFAAAHRRASGRAASRHAASPADLLDELRVPRDVRTASLSGGQRQRLAIARALAYDPQVILYDEPTSGLDVASALQVSELIRSTHAAHRKTSIVVTHDYESLSRIADRIYLLDPARRSLVEVPRDDWPRLGEMLTAATRGLAVREDAAPEKPRSRLRSDIGAIVGGVGDFFEGTSRFVERAAMLPLRLWPLWKSVPWGLRFLAHYLRLVADPSAWVYVAVAGAILGFVSTYFTFRFLPYRAYTEPLIIENLLHALGFTLYRILVPALATILIAARCGAAVASDVGGKSYGQQLAALQTFGARPTRYLATNILYAFLLGTPILVAISFTAARWTSLLVFSATHSEFGPFFWDAHFHRELIAPGQWFYRGTAWLAAKVLCCAAGMAVIAYDRGAEAKHSSKDVSLGITSTILWATLYVLAVHLGFALFEFESEIR